MFLRAPHTGRNDAAGFTLLELAIVMVISGFLLVGFLTIYKSTMDSLRNERMTRVMQNAQTGVVGFQGKTGRYPCPANPATPYGDPNYGKEDCTMATVAGARDTNFDTDTAADRIYIGYLPDYGLSGTTPITLSSFFSNAESLSPNLIDPYNNRLIYAVTVSLTNSTTYNAEYGAIAVEDEFNNPTGGINKDAHFVIVSEGADGTHKWPCGIPTRPIEYRNCDNNGTFTKGILSLSTDANYYDDRITFVTLSDGGIWENMVVGDDTSGFPVTKTVHLKTKSNITGNAGIKNATPSEKLDVAGNILASQNVRAVQACTTQTSSSGSTTSCLNPASFYNNVKCATTYPPQYPYKIAVSASGTFVVTCAPLAIQNPPAAQAPCPGTIQGVYSDGTVVCQP